jgi:hypothetical protein
MKKDTGFNFLPKKWLGDANILAMDWDCKAMHFHLICIAFQQEKQGYLIDDDSIFKKLLGNPDIDDWNNRIKKQIFSAWKKKIIKENGKELVYWYQSGLLNSINESNSINIPVEKKKRKSVKDFLIFEEIDAQQDGFDLKSLLKVKPHQTILYEKPLKATDEEKHTIWTLGISIVEKQTKSETRARGFLAKLIKDYGEKSVAQAIAQLSLSKINPVDIHSYLIGTLNKLKEDTVRKTGRGSVSI